MVRFVAREMRSVKEKHTRKAKAASQKFLADLRQKSRADEKALGAADFDQLFAMIRLQAEAFGNPESVTPPNLASLMLLV